MSLLSSAHLGLWGFGLFCFGWAEPLKLCRSFWKDDHLLATVGWAELRLAPACRRGDWEGHGGLLAKADAVCFKLPFASTFPSS